MGHEPPAAFTPTAPTYDADFYRARVGVLEARVLDLEESANPKVWADNVALCDAVRRSAYDAGLPCPRNVGEMVATLAELSARLSAVRSEVTERALTSQAVGDINFPPEPEGET